MRVSLKGESTLTGNVDVFVFVGDMFYELAANGLRAKAVSGPYGNGPAPKGSYRITPPVAIDPTADSNKGFLDPKGNAWFAALHPEFETDRIGLGIHPDGNVPGTLGCIGIQLEDTTFIRDALKRGGLLYVL